MAQDDTFGYISTSTRQYPRPDGADLRKQYLHGRKLHRMCADSARAYPLHLSILLEMVLAGE